MLLFGGLLAAARLPAQAVLSGAGGIDLRGGADFTISSQSSSIPRFLWLPGKSALRVGAFYETPDPASIGQGSIALGHDAMALGDNSVALGPWSTAEGESSFATAGASASGEWSTATATGYASGFSSFAAGEGSSAEGDNSFAVSYGRAAAYRAVALSGNAEGNYSLTAVLGHALGDWSAAIGQDVEVRAMNGMGVGTYNLGTRKSGGGYINSYTAYPDDPLFEVGNGTYLARSNALTVFRDGTVRLSKASGGISMGQFQ